MGHSARSSTVVLVSGLMDSVSELFGLEDQVAVVTGASGVLGGAIARGLAAAGGNVPAATVGERSFFELPSAALDEVVRLNFHGTVLPSPVFGAAMTVGADEPTRTVI